MLLRADPAAPTVEPVTDTAGLEALRPAWAELWERSPRATPFQAPEWLLPWWRHFGGEGLWTLTVREGGDLVGLAPFLRYTDPQTGVRQLTLVGNGISDTLDLLAAAGHERQVAGALARFLQAHAREWDTADLRDLPEESTLLSPGFAGRLRAEVEEDTVSPVLPLPAAGEPLSAVVPKRLLSNLRYSRRRAEREGGVRFVPAGPENAGAMLDELIRLHRERWESRGEPGVLTEPSVADFHREVVRGTAAAGILRLYALQVDGETRGVYYGFAAKGRSYYYLGGFDPEMAHLSPGSLLVEHAIEESVREGAGEFDFLRGSEPYKYTWGARDHAKWRVRLQNRP